jgi:hypothetical protein
MTKTQEAISVLKELEKLLDERIVENELASGTMMVRQATHAFILYRSKVWDAVKLLRTGEKNGTK